MCVVDPAVGLGAGVAKANRFATVSTGVRVEEACPVCGRASQKSREKLGMDKRGSMLDGLTVERKVK